jgi:hypothetical protein
MMGRWDQVHGAQAAHLADMMPVLGAVAVGSLDVVVDVARVAGVGDTVSEMFGFLEKNTWDGKVAHIALLFVR